MTRAYMQDYYYEQNFVEIVQVTPAELNDGSPDTIAAARLHEQLARLPNMYQLVSAECPDSPEVARRSGNLCYHYHVRALVFRPEEGHVLEGARIDDVLHNGITLTFNKTRFIVPETLLRCHGIKWDLRTKSMIHDNVTYGLGSVVKIKLIKVQKHERNGHVEYVGLAEVVV